MELLFDILIRLIAAAFTAGTVYLAFEGLKAAAKDNPGDAGIAGIFAFFCAVFAALAWWAA